MAEVQALIIGFKVFQLVAAGCCLRIGWGLGNHVCGLVYRSVHKYEAASLKDSAQISAMRYRHYLDG